MLNGSQEVTRTPFRQSPSRHAFHYKAFEECKRNILSKPYPDDGSLYCNATFDNWLCWDFTPAGQSAFQRCPYDFIEGFNRDEFAEKKCMPDGTWFVNKLSNRTWTNYMPCTTHEENLSVLLVYISGYVLSVLLCVACIIIFSIFRQLRCTRVIMHQHLFLSYIITGVLWTVSYTQLVLKVDVIRENPVWCKVVHVLTQYISLSNYCWMFCEGLFLHTIIVHAFSKEKKLLRICYGVGWAVPVVPTIIYACIRAVDQELDKECWIPHSWALWTIIAPVIVSLIVNFAFFLNILRILMSKLRAFNSHEQLQYRRAVKAVLIMIPLFGTNNLIMLVRPEMSREGVRVWKIISAFLVAYQGVAVSLIFCFFNGEVMTVLRRKWSQWRHTHDHGVLGRLRSTSNTMAITMDDMSAANRNGYPTTTSKTASKHAQDPTELHLMMNSQKKSAA
ncbi:calcitonin gene-related peptide type 1 receptor-like isoform X2 [Pomacea canaliculata]|nr:calcitonin gene-related peptide type 1 receptor-like isoform X2 [Pomacea canaliculata]XP_025094084.1 calcitonin gene-related peptide type 1 receptor-like isoform X2 [Pomacea canaliculata]